MKGHVARKGNCWYAVIYDGTDPVTGKEKRTWHAAGTERADAERLAAHLAAERNGRNDQTRSLTFGAYLTRQWLPGKQVVLAASTYAGYRRNVERHILPSLGRIPLRRLRPHHLEGLYASLLHRDDGGGLGPKTVYEIHLVIRGALTDAVRRGLVARNVALVAHAPRLRAIPKVEHPGPPKSCKRSCGRRPGTGCSPRCGRRRSPACAATSCSVCAGATSTSARQPCR